MIIIFSFLLKESEILNEILNEGFAMKWLAQIGGNNR